MSGARGDGVAPVVVRGLAKRYGASVALDDVSLDVRPGELFGLVGPDGGGKTTLFRILATLVLPDAGEATVLGLDVVRDLWAVRERVGYMPGRFSLYPDLTVAENLRFFAAVFGTTVEEGRATIAPIWSQIEPFRDRRAGALSGGMKQKLALCCALVHRPDLLLLDEPTTGVDAVSRRELWELLGALRLSGLPIVVSTPYMDEAGRCDRVALVQRGRILAVDAPGALGRRFPLPLVAVRSERRHAVLHAIAGELRLLPHVASVHPFGAELHVADRRPIAAETVAAELRAALRARGHADVEVALIAPGIEDAFMALLGAQEAA